MCVISITNAKGGVGKTTTTYNLGAAFAQSRSGKKILLIDNDPQGSLTKALGFSADKLPLTLANLMFAVIDSPEEVDAYIKRTILHSDSGLDLIPANKKLAGVVSRLIVMQTTNTMLADDETPQSEFIMRELLTHVTDQYDFILIDCGPKTDLQMINALSASDRVIIPVQAHYLDAEGLPDTMDIVRRVKQALNPGLLIEGILLTMYRKRTLLSRSVREEIYERFGAETHVFDSPIDFSIRVAEHPAYGESLLQYAPSCPAAQSYVAVAEEVLHNVQA